MRTALSLFLATATLLTTSCAPSEANDVQAAGAAAIQALDEQWSATAAKNDLAGTMAFYAKDAVLLPSQSTYRRGSEINPRIMGGLARSEYSRIVEGFQSRDGKLRRPRVPLWDVSSFHQGSEARFDNQ
jgi:hypothetical protein